MMEQATKVFMDYAAAFEQTYVDDDWSRLTSIRGRLSGRGRRPRWREAIHSHGYKLLLKGFEAAYSPAPFQII